jgi:hypothetical protein
MKRTLLFILLVSLCFAVRAQVNPEQDIINLKKQVNSAKYENSKLKKQLNETTIDLNAKIVALESLIQTTDSSVNSQANILVKNSTVVKEMKEDSNRQFKYVKMIAWISLILVIILIVYAIILHLRQNKATRAIYITVDMLKSEINEKNRELRISMENVISDARLDLNDKVVSLKKSVEEMISNNYKTTDENIQAVKNYIQESQKSNVEQIEKIKVSLEGQKSILEGLVKAECGKLQADNAKAISSLKDELAKMNEQNKELKSALKSETAKVLADTNKNIGAIKEEVAKLKLEKSKKNNKKNGNTDNIA